MGIVSGIVVYLMIWWTVIFCVLPFGLERDEDGTPVNPRLKQKLLITTAVSALLWCGVYALIASDLISFHDMAKEMSENETMEYK